MAKGSDAELRGRARRAFARVVTSRCRSAHMESFRSVHFVLLRRSQSHLCFGASPDGPTNWPGGRCAWTAAWLTPG